MSLTDRAWLIAASVGVVEAMKDQDFCRWNYALRLLQQCTMTDLRSFFQTQKLSYAAAVTTAKRQQQKSKQSEESLREVMYLSCWGPN